MFNNFQTIVFQVATVTADNIMFSCGEMQKILSPQTRVLVELPHFKMGKVNRIRTSHDRRDRVVSF